MICGSTPSRKPSVWPPIVLMPPLVDETVNLAITRVEHCSRGDAVRIEYDLNTHIASGSVCFEVDVRELEWLRQIGSDGAVHPETERQRHH